jgi:hypothetical protein
MDRRAVVIDPCLFCGKRGSETHDELCLTRRGYDVVEVGPRGGKNRTARRVSPPIVEGADKYRGEYWYNDPRRDEEWMPWCSGDAEYLPCRETNFSPESCYSRYSHTSTKGSGPDSPLRPPPPKFQNANAAPPEVLGPMDDIVTYWGPYTTLSELQASPFYARIEIPVNPLHFEQRRNDIFSPRSLYHAILPEALAGAIFTLHAVLPIPARYLNQMSTLQLQHLVVCMCDVEYDEFARVLAGNTIRRDYLERVERMITTLGRIERVCGQRVGEGGEDRSALNKIRVSVVAFEEYWQWVLRVVLDREADARGGSSIPPPPPPRPARTRSCTPSGSISDCSSSIAPLPKPESRPKRKAFSSQSRPKDTFQNWPPVTPNRTTPRVPQRHKPRVPAQKPNSPPRRPASNCSTLEPSGPKIPPPSMPSINIIISPEDLLVLDRVAKYEGLSEAALRTIRRIVRDGSSGETVPDRGDGGNAKRKTGFGPATRRERVVQTARTHMQPSIDQVAIEEFLRVLREW